MMEPQEPQEGPEKLELPEALDLMLLTVCFIGNIPLILLSRPLSSQNKSP